MMRRTIIKLAAVVAASVACAFAGLTLDRAGRLHHKTELVKQSAQRWLQDGKNPGQALALMEKAGEAFTSGNPDLGESLIDQALKFLDDTGKTSQTATTYALGVTTAVLAPGSNLYTSPEAVEIIGYDQDCMEPCISLDGQYLFFNGSNEGDVDVHIHYAKRVSACRFQYLGLVTGVQSAHRDMAPSLDLQNNFLFTSLRSFGQDHKTLYLSQWRPTAASNPVAIEGDISKDCGESDKTQWLNMDCGISPDGNTLIFSRAQFAPGEGSPRQSDLIIANRDQSGQFYISPQSSLLLKSVNSPALEYAPSLSSDGLELYFTRALTAQQLVTGKNEGAPFQTMVAKRSSLGQPFAEPIRLAAVAGFAEAPSITLDKGEIFFHKKVGKIFRIYRALRSPPS